MISGDSYKDLNLGGGRNWPTSSEPPPAATAAIKKAKKKRGKILKGQSRVMSSPREDTKVPHCSASLATRQVHPRTLGEELVIPSKLRQRPNLMTRFPDRHLLSLTSDLIQPLMR